MVSTMAACSAWIASVLHVVGSVPYRAPGRIVVRMMIYLSARGIGIHCNILVAAATLLSRVVVVVDVVVLPMVTCVPRSRT